VIAQTETDAGVRIREHRARHIRIAALKLLQLLMGKDKTKTVLAGAR